MSLISPSRCLPAALIFWRSGMNVCLPEVLGLLLEHLGVADDGVERRPQLVGHVRQELRLVLRCHFESPPGLLDLLEEAGVLDGDDRLICERLDEIDHRLRELPGDLAANDQRADDPAFAPQRHGQHRVEAFGEQHPANRVVRPACEPVLVEQP